MKLIRDRYTSVGVWCRAVTTGYTFKDKLAIFFNRILHLTYPLVRSVYVITGKQIFSPRHVIKQFKCHNEYGIFSCPGGSTDLEFTKDYEPSVRTIIQNLKHGTYVDVGGHVGLYAIMASKILGKNGKVVSIEPSPTLFNALQKNVEMNHCDNVKLEKIAAWDKNETLRLCEPLFGVDDYGNSVVQNSSTRFYEVKGMPLDEVLHDSQISLIKVDVEGAEPHVWSGLRKTLVENKDAELVFEALNDDALKESSKILEPYGFIIHQLPDGNYHAFRKTSKYWKN